VICHFVARLVQFRINYVVVVGPIFLCLLAGNVPCIFLFSLHYVVP